MGESTLRGPASFRAHAVRLIPPLQIRGHSGTAMMIDFSCEDHDMMKTGMRMVVIKSLLPIPAQPQSHKNPVSASAMLTGKFLQIRKVFATSSLLAEEFPDTLQYKISR